MLRKRNFRGLHESYSLRCGRKNLNESVLDGMTVAEFCSLSRRKRFDIVEQFCKEHDIQYTVILDSGKFTEEDGSFDDIGFQVYEQDYVEDVIEDMASNLQEVLADGDSNPDAWNDLYYSLNDLDMPQNFHSECIKLYDIQGEVWPKPPKQ